MHQLKLLLILVVHITFYTALPGSAKIMTLKTREGVSQSFLLIENDNAVATVILFAGGHGNLGLTSSNENLMSWGSNNFLLRSRELFVNQGFNVVVLDAPSDRKSADGMLYGFRTCFEHVADIDFVMAFLRRRSRNPIWLVGTSRGTESVAFSAIFSLKPPSGVVLTSSMSEENKKGDSLPELMLDKIKIPVFIAAHEKDRCWVTRPEGATFQSFRGYCTLLLRGPSVSLRRLQWIIGSWLFGYRGPSY